MITPPQERQDPGGEHSRVNVLGIPVSAIDMSMALETIDGWISRREHTYVCVAAAHSLMACYRDPALRRVFNRSGMTTPDGMPLVWMCQVAGHRHVQRVYGPDLMLATCAHGVGLGFRHFFCGGEPGVAKALAERLRARFPGLQVVGTLAPPFGETLDGEHTSIAEYVNAAQPHIVWIGLGTSTQEYWMARNRSGLEAPVLIGVGAAFDFLSGRKPQAPHWMQSSGLEWLFRLAHEPKRLWPRYREYPLFVLLLLSQLLHLCTFPIEE